MSLLTNVSNLILPRQWLYPLYPPSRDLFDALAIVACGASGQALSRLRRLESWGYDEDQLSLQDLHAFLVLPNLHELLCDGYAAIVDDHVNQPFDWLSTGSTSQLQKVELFWCCINGAELQKLLPHTPKLQSFKLAYTRHSRYDWDVSAVVQALYDHCRCTLTEISITVDRLYGNCKGGMRSFDGFTALEHLELDLRFFSGPPVTEELLHLSPAQYRDHASSVPWSVTSLPTLIEMLPPTIKTVRLLTGSDPGEPSMLKRLFSGWNIKSIDALPLLTRVEVAHGTETMGWVPVEPEHRAHNLLWWLPAKEAVEAAGCIYCDNMSVMAGWVEKIAFDVD